jgi:Flp pilus assembly protein TadG
MKTQKTLLPGSERGQSLVELAVSLVILLYLLSGAVEFGIIFFQFVQLRDAAQEGALYGSINAPPDPASDPTLYATRVAAIETRAKSASSSPIDLINDPNVTVTVTVPDGKYCESGSLQVQVGYPHQIFMPFLPQLIGRSTIPLNAQVTDTILTPVCPSP